MKIWIRVLFILHVLHVLIYWINIESKNTYDWGIYFSCGLFILSALDFITIKSICQKYMPNKSINLYCNFAIVFFIMMAYLCGSYYLPGGKWLAGSNHVIYCITAFFGLCVVIDLILECRE